jgi:hypothetical protein
LMNKILKRPIVVGVTAVLVAASASAGAVGLSNVTTNGVNIAYWSLNSPPASCELGKSTTDPGQPARDAIVQGINSPCVSNADPGPGGNIELGDVDANVWAAASTLTGQSGTFGTITLSSLTLADWQTVVAAPGVSLAAQYISEAIEANCGEPPSAPVLAASVACFLNGTAATCGVAIVPPPAERASDPNIAYANTDANGQMEIGLAGALNAADLLPPGFVCPNNGQAPSELRLSEVVKFNASWATDAQYQDQYLYSFNATASGVTTDDPTQSYDAIYEVEPVLPIVPIVPPAPVPAVSALGLAGGAAGLLAVGLAGLRRRRSG